MTGASVEAYVSMSRLDVEEFCPIDAVNLEPTKKNKQIKLRWPVYNVMSKPISDHKSKHSKFNFQQ